MTDRLRELREIVRNMPPEGSVTLPVTWLRDLLDAEGDSFPMRLLNLDEAAVIVGRSSSTIRTWCNSGALGGAFKLSGRTWRIPEADLRRFLERQQSVERQPATVRADGPVDLSAWRKHVEAKNGSARTQRGRRDA